MGGELAKTPMNDTDKNNDETIAETHDDPIIEDAEVVDEDISDNMQDASDLSGEDEPNTPEVVEEPTMAQQDAPSKGAGFLTMLLGGVAAGGIGYFIADYTRAEDPTAQINAQAEQIADLQDRLENLPVTDLSGLETQISDVASTLETTTGAIGEQIAAIDVRLTTVERQPNADGTLSETALAAYQQELDDLRAELDAQQSAVMTAASQAEQDLAAARAEAERLEQEALAAAEAAQARAAINRIAAAVETGAPFADALSDLDADIPAALSDAADTGVATTASLVDAFPAAARSALSVARSEGMSDDAGGLGGFLRSQFDVRSTSPQEGSGPDAVLSRAEAAVKEGRVADALAELDALPEVVRADLTDWTSRAQERADVLSAISTLSETYQ